MKLIRQIERYTYLTLGVCSISIAIQLTFFTNVFKTGNMLDDMFGFVGTWVVGAVISVASLYLFQYIKVINKETL